MDDTRSPVVEQSIEPPQELERVYEGEIVDPETPSWEETISEWADAASSVLRGQLRQARVAAAVSKIWGRSSVTEFAKEVGESKSTVYSYARVWWIYGHLFEDGEFSRRLEESPLTISHYIEASHAPDPQAAIEEAEINGLTTRAIKARSQEAKVQEHAEDERAEVVDTAVCPRCGGDGVVPVD